jgi:hypothetical protein
MSQGNTLTFRQKARLVGYLFLFGGVVVAFFSLTQLWLRLEMARTYQRAKGVVIGHQVRERMVRSAGMPHRKEYFYPIVAYRTDKGEFTLEGQVADESPFYEEGQEVQVLYPPDHPERGIIENYSEMYFVGMFRGGLALVLFFCSYVAIVVVPKMRGEPPESAVN